MSDKIHVLNLLDRRSWTSTLKSNPPNHALNPKSQTSDSLPAVTRQIPCLSSGLRRQQHRHISDTTANIPKPLSMRHITRHQCHIPARAKWRIPATTRAIFQVTDGKRTCATLCCKKLYSKRKPSPTTSDDTPFLQYAKRIRYALSVVWCC